MLIPIVWRRGVAMSGKRWSGMVSVLAVAAALAAGGAGEA